MNNKYDCGCDGGSFVPVTSNWDFNMDGCCQRQNRCNSGQAHNDARNSRNCERQENVCREKQCCSQPAARYEKNACTGTADCTCDACMLRRQANKPRQADSSCQMTVNRQTECTPCDKQQKKVNNRGVGIVWAKWQELDTIYDCEHALKAGTLYPELHKPMNGYWPCEENCADGKQEAAFMLWELRLYLNTHPNDREALALFRQLCEKAEGTYAAAFLPQECARWAWTDDPWPWEYDCQCRK